MKRLLIQVGISVLVALVIAIALGWVVSQYGEGVALRALVVLSVVILALFSIITSLVMAAIYFVLAWAVGRYGGKATFGAHWLRGKTEWAEAQVETGAERFAVRPLARTTGTLTTGATLVHNLIAGPAARLDLSHETTRWRTRLNRVRGRAMLPASPAEPPQRNERDVQPGPGVAV